ncbi:hypothetical protein RGQ29_033009 [Quercus rubra]|uniref:PGG domain-containing protein n=1 Tax=Quercus rubra TaxID=3512 RepID=A0AAN7DUB9_QUERU|nr:hypothetical protein RGQ29_033009 [Quercus rubra]
MVELMMIYFQPQCVKTPTTTEKSRTGSKSPTVRSKEAGSDERNSNTEDFYSKTKESHLLVSILIATVTFAAGLTMPGGYVTDKGHEQGTAVLIRSNAFKAFAVTNALVQAMSTASVFIHIFMEMRDGNPILAQVYQVTWGTTAISSMPTMMIAYVTGTYTVLDSSSGFAIAYIVISILSLVLIFYVLGLLLVVVGVGIRITFSKILSSFKLH